jgi:hypothetical protein
MGQSCHGGQLLEGIPLLRRRVVVWQMEAALLLRISRRFLRSVAVILSAQDCWRFVCYAEAARVFRDDTSKLASALCAGREVKTRLRTRREVVAWSCSAMTR